MGQFLIFIAIGVAMYFMMIRPQQKRMKEAQDMLSSLEKGDHIVTVGGLHGIIEEVNDTTVVLDCEGVYLTFERRAVARIAFKANAALEGDVIDAVEEIEEVESLVEDGEVEEVKVEDIVTDMHEN